MLGKLSILRTLTKFIGGKWKIAIIGLFVAAFAWHYYSIISERDQLRSDLQDCESRIEDFVKQEEKFIERIDQYNERTEELQQQTEELEQRAEETREENIRLEERLTNELDDIDEESIESCEEGSDFLLNNAIERN